MRTFYIKDPELLFCDDNKALDPCYGLSMYGPYGLKKFKLIKIALIGSSESILDVENLLTMMRTKIINNKSLKWPFPGLGSEILKFDIQISNKQVFNNVEMKFFEDLDSNNRISRIKYTISLIESKIKIITDIEPRPDIILISIPIEVLKACRDKRFRYTNTILLVNRQFDTGLENYQEGHNFHHIIKIIGMENGIPTQLIYPKTLIPNPKKLGRQDLSMIAWNLAVALLYKANELPWKYFEFPYDTCFVGISFHKEFGEEDEYVMRSSIAQIFLSNGRDFVLRGDKFIWDEKSSRSPHMSKDYAYKLMQMVLEKYEQQWGKSPNRVVIHKSSEYWEEEVLGIEESLSDVKNLDLISLASTDIRFFRLGQETIVRGTLVEFHGKYYLYNVGYIPSLNTYPGARIPTPVEIKFHRTDSDKIDICKEILALARLDWNSVDYSTKFPVTITFSRNVGKILSEYRAKSFINHPDKYRYFM